MQVAGKTEAEVGRIGFLSKGSLQSSTRVFDKSFTGYRGSEKLE